ncbi:MAG TPA: SDR family oxidoreductase [Candidatus Obscuribacterales bacterium]
MKGLTALVTGGGSGIGLATARLLLDQGANVMIVGRDKGKLQRAVDELGMGDDRLRMVSGDVSSEGYANKLVRDTVTAFGALNILVNSAGVFRKGSILEMLEEEFDYTLNVNLKGTWFMCKFGARAMIASGGGAIVNVSSLLAKRSFANFPTAAYSASKGAIVSLTQALAVELAQHKIRCNVVLPSLVRTGMVGEVFGDEDLDATLERASKRYPAGRVGTPEDVARAIVFLANPENEWLTGVEMTVDGGVSLT